MRSRMKRYIVTFLCFALYLNASIENSIIPLVQKFESVDNLPAKKFSDNQFQEIFQALNQVDQKIRIATYNVLFNLYDHTLDEVNRWPQRLPRVVELLNEMQPDVLGVQELYPDQLEGLMPYLGNTYDFFAEPCGDDELNGIFYRRDRFEVVESQVYSMASIPGDSSRETLTLLKLKDLKTGKMFAVFNTHLAFSKINKRDAQVRFIADQIASLGDDIPLIFMGDLNTFPNRLDLAKLPAYDGDYIQRLLTQGPLRDARQQALLGHLGPISTFTNGSDNGTPFTGEGTPGIFLDHIYVTKGITVLIHAVQPAKVDGHFPSDHMPILVDFYID